MTRRGRPKRTLLGVRVTALVDLYRWRLSKHKAQELLAGMGIAVGVALLFGVLVASSSLVGSADQLLHAITGHARFQLAARSAEGFPEKLANQVSALPGVKVAAPLLRENAVIAGPEGRKSIEIVGVSPSQVELEGDATKDLGGSSPLVGGGLAIPSAVASAIGAQASEPVTLLSGGGEHRLQVSLILGSQTVGPVADSPIVVAFMTVAQRVTDKLGRVSEEFVEPRPGADRLVERELLRVSAGRLSVTSATHELSVLKATAAPTSQSTTLFAAISAMVGFLLALNAMLLTVPERRRFVAELRQQGFGPRQVFVILISQAMILGVLASVLGILLGEVLSGTLFRQAPSYLTLAFPIGTRPVVPASTVVLALGCGVLATILASLVPVMDLRGGRQSDAVLHDPGEAGQNIGRRVVLASGLLGAILVAMVSVFVWLLPDLSVEGGVVLALAAFLLVPCMFAFVVRLLRPVSERLRGSMLALAVVELDGSATRSVALAGVAALAVYGVVAVQGARSDLVSGLDAAVVQYLDTADVWVTTSDNFLTVDSFKAKRARAALSRLPSVASVRDYQGSLLDVGTRRLWIRARPSGDRALIQSSQLIEGNLVRATQRIRAGGWAALSDGFAKERHLRVGDTFVLPTPSGPARFGVAAITTNVGWPPGAITLNAADYSRDWHSVNPSALEVNFKPGVQPAVGKRLVERALGSSPGLLVESFDERKQRFDESASQGIKGLSEISTLLLIATALALASALSAGIWQRRSRLASLKSHGFDSQQVWRSLLIESAILLSIGCLDGAVLGIYGHALADRWLKLSIGFPAPFSLGVGLVLLTLASIVCVALIVVALPGLAAARVLPRASFQE